MSDISHLILPGCALLLLIGILTVRGFGVIKLDWMNSRQLREFKKARLISEDPSEQAALDSIIGFCQRLNSKWILRESDLAILDNTHGLVKNIALAYHPNSKTPVEEARIRRVLQAFMDLKDRLLVLMKWKGVHALTQFRLRHVLFLSRAWKVKETWKEWRAVKFLARHGIYSLFKWVFLIVRWMDWTFWTLKMMAYIIHDIVFKVFLVKWYLIIGELAMQVYRDREKEPEIPADDLLEDLDSIPESENPADLPEEVRKISETSRNNILFHTWFVEWDKVKGVYVDLVNNIARTYYPRANQPVYEAKLFDLFMGVVRFSEKIAAIRTYPYLHKLLDIRVSHLLMVKDTADSLINSQTLAWIKKYKLAYFFKYAFMLFKVVKMGNPLLLFQDFALTLAGEGCKRWFYLYLHDEITVETNSIYKTVAPCTPTNAETPLASDA